MARKPLFSRFMAGILSVILLIFFLFTFSTANAAPLATITVSPTTPNEWGAFLESGTNGSVTFVPGPTTPPSGTGSARFVVGNSVTGVALARQAYAGQRFDEITTLTYSTYKIAGTPSTLDVSLQFNVDYNLTDGNTAFQGRIVHEPYFTTPLPDNVWNSVDALAGEWWATGAPGNGTCPQANPCTWSELLTAFPNAGVQTGGLAAVLFKMGSGAPSFDGNVDNFHIVTSGGVDDTYDFENSAAPGPACTTTCYVSTLGNDSNGGASAGDPLRNIQTGITNVSVGGTVVVAPGTYFEALTVNKWLTLDGAGSGTNAAVDTIITPASPTLTSLNVTSGGSSAVNRSVFQDFRLTRAVAPTGLPTETGSGIALAGVSFVTFSNVVSNWNGAYGVSVSGTGADHLFQNVTLSGNYSSGWRSSSTTSINGVTFEDSLIAASGQIGLATGGGTNSANHTNFVLRNTTFDGNGTRSFAGAGLGFGDISFFKFNGNLTIEDVTVTGMPVNGPHIGVQIRGSDGNGMGVAPLGPSGTVIIDNLDISGNYRRPGGAASNPGGPGNSLRIQDYAVGGTFTINDLTVDSGSQTHGVVVTGVSPTLDLANADLTGSLAVIAIETSGANPTGASNVTATGATINGTSTLAATLSQLFAMEDLIIHRIDTGTPITVNAVPPPGTVNAQIGLVRVRANNIYVTANSFLAPFTTTPRIQRGVDAASAGNTVNVGAGSFNENVTINKSLTLDGVGSGTSASDTILDGTSMSGHGINVDNAITNVTIRDLRVRLFASGSGIHGVGGNNGLTVQGTALFDNNSTVAVNGGGLYMNGPVSNVTIDNNNVANNRARGIVIWNGFKQNITITNNTVTGNNCCGIELQDGTASGVTVTGNIVTNNTDSGMAFIGLTDGAGPNLIANNTVSGTGRFGIEIKLPDGSGLDSGDGSIVVEENTVTLSGPPVDARDVAGISVYRRGYVVGFGYVDIPTGVIVRENEVNGYQQPSTSDGFGIVVEGTNHLVENNELNNNDVGVQSQGGHLPYTPNNGPDGDQSNLNDQFFGRGNSPIGCPISLSGNIFSGNSTNTRTVGTGGFIRATNLNTLETFCTIQAAIDDAQTLNGHVIEIEPGVHNEAVQITKSITLQGAGAGTSASDTVLDGNSPNPLTGNGITVATGVANVTIQDLRVQEFGTTPSGGSGVRGAQNNNLTIQRVHAYNNNTGSADLSSNGGIYLSGPISNVTIDDSHSVGNQGRGIVVWDGVKQDITITDNLVTNNNCCGIELQDGTASGVTVTGNTVTNNTDSGIGLIGLTDGAGANLIANNNVSGTGRFGIEIKLPDGSGSDTGDGSIVVQGNTVTLSASPVDARDVAGISVYRRGYTAANVDIPTGVIVRNNTVNGFQQPSVSEGFGIVVEGVNHEVTNNTLNNNNVGVQVQGGHLPYTPNSGPDGDQSNLNDQFFGRGNAPYGCAAVSGNTFSGNSTNTRSVGNGGAGIRATNTTTLETFCTIQAAIDDANTVAGHTIEVVAGTFEEQVEVNKAITLEGQGEGLTTIVAPLDMPDFFNSGADNNYPIIYVHGVNATIRDLTVDGDGRGNLNYRFFGVAFEQAGGTLEDVTITGVTETPFNGNQHGNGIWARANNGTNRTLTVTDVTITDFQKNGTTFSGANLTVTMQESTVVGSGALGLGLPAQNGIQLSGGAFGSFDNNDISSIVYTPATFAATGYLISGAGGTVDISNSTITDTTTAIYYINTEGDLTDNTIINTPAGMSGAVYWWGGIIYNTTASPFAPTATPTLPELFDTGDSNGESGAALALVNRSYTIDGNSFTGGGDGDGLSIYADAPEVATVTINENSFDEWATGLYLDGAGTLNATVTANTLADNDVGIQSERGTISITNNVLANNGTGVLVSGTGTIAPTIYQNSIVSTGLGVNKTAAGIALVNASANWWGGNAPATVAGELSAGVDYTPWFNVGTDTSGMAGWQGDFSWFNADDDSPQTGAVGRINEAITLVTTGGTVNLAAGSYNETATVPKSLTLQGAGATTVLDGNTPSATTGNGITLNGGVTNVTIQDLRVQDYGGAAPGGSGIHGTLSNHNTIVRRTELHNNNLSNAANGGGLYMNGPVNNVTIDDNDVVNNRSRGIVIWNGLKTNITITNNYVANNNCCGIELQDGTATGVTATGNIVENNSDSGMAFIGLMGPGENLIANNTVSGTGRFGIEIKLPDGSGLPTGVGRIVVENNTVTLSGAPANNRDLAGISVYRRGYVVGNGNVDIPVGVIVRNNEVNGYQQPSASDGFGIVVEGVNHQVLNNELNNNDVGVQVQGGHLPYTPNTAVDGNQDVQGDQFFGRGNAPYGCAVVSGNIFSGNSTNTRSVGNGGAGVRATNLDTGETFCTIQAAIDDAQTLNGHTIDIEPGSHVEQVELYKELTLQGDGEGSTIIQAPPTLSSDIVAGYTNFAVLYVRDVTTATVTGLTIDFNYNAEAYAVGYPEGVLVKDSGVEFSQVSIINAISTNPANYGLQLGEGLYACNDSTDRTITFDDVTVSNFQKNGLTLDCDNLHAVVVNSSFTGLGNSNIIAQNGVQLGGGATGTITNNSFNAISYTPSTYMGSGVLLFDNGSSVPVEDNTFTNVQAGVYAFDTEVDVLSNTIGYTAMGGTVDYAGVIIESANAAPFAPSTQRTQPAREMASRSERTALLARSSTVNENTLTGTGIGKGVWLNADAPESTSVQIYRNSITGFGTGVVIDGVATLTASVTENFLTNNGYGVRYYNGAATVSYNSITGSTTLAIEHANYPTVTTIPNGSANWYGVNTPAAVDALVSANVDYTPWFNVGTDTSGSAGWQGDFSWFNADDDSPQTGAVGRINEAITLVTTGGTVNLAAGTYNETATVPKSLTLQGAGATTILDGNTPSATTGNGITLNSGVTNVTIQDLRVQDYGGAPSGGSGIFGTLSNHNTIVRRTELVNNNLSNGANGGGLYMNGPVNNVTIDDNDAVNNRSRGIVIWNGLKTNITITNNYVANNICCGIELQDGTASGITVTGNIVENNGDSGMAFIGLQGGSGANLIANNTITNNGRFGIEIKLPNGNGATSGDGSIVVENNTVTRNVPIPGAEQRDLAGISVYRRGWLAGNVDIPVGVVVRGNTVTGYAQPTTSDGFGIVVEGSNHQVLNNTLNNNDVGVQVQGGHLPYTANTSTDGDQSNLNDQFFGRGNAPLGCPVTVTGNTFSGNTTSTRYVGNASGGFRATNANTTEQFCTIQGAIDDADTANTHTINIAAGVWEEQVEVYKDLTLQGAGIAATTIQSPLTLPKFFTSPGNNNYPVVLARNTNNVTIRDLTVDGAGRGNSNYRFTGVAFENVNGTVENVRILEIRNTPIDGTQHGIALWGRAQSGTPRTLNVNNVTLDGFQKNGTAFSGANLTVTMNNSNVIGEGAINFTAQNGIQLSGGATGSFDNNSVTGFTYTPYTFVSTGYLLFGASGTVNITNGDINESLVGAYYYNTQGNVTDNSFLNSAAGMGGAPYWFGVILENDTAAPFADDGRTLTPSPYDAGDGEVENLLLNRSYLVEDNTFTGGGNGAGVAVYANAAEVATVTIQENDFTDWETGLYLSATQTLNSDIVANNITLSDIGIQTEGGNDVDINNNIIDNNGTGVLVSNGTLSPTIFENSITNTGLGVSKTAAGIPVVDASANWWGSDVPATVAAEVSAGVDYTPWIAVGTDNAPTVGWQGNFNTLHADDNSPQTGSAGRVQEAVTLVNANGLVYAEAGTYEETVSINGKDLTVQGRGQGVSTILSTTSVPSCWLPDRHPIVCIQNTGNVTFRDLTVDGDGRGNGDAIFYGIAYRNAGGTVEDVSIVDVAETPLSGTQSGVALYACADNGTARTLTVDQVTLTGFQKNGTAFNCANLTVTMNNSVVQGAGPVNFIAQNGIQLAFGATGSFSNNQISNIGYIPASDVATGYLLYQASSTTLITNSDLEDVEVGADAFDSALTFTTNEITQTTAGMGGMPTWYGVLIDSVTAAPLTSDAGELMVQPFGEEDSDGNSANAMMNRTHLVNDNTMTSEGLTGTAIGTDVDAVEITSLNILTNTMTGWDVGVEFDGDGLLAATVDDNIIASNNVGIVIRTGVLNITNNGITMNDVGIRYFDSDGIEPEVHQNDIDYNTTWGVEHATFGSQFPPTIVDATSNYWGDVTGPLDEHVPGDAPCTSLMEYNPTSTGNPVSECVRWEPALEVTLANFEAIARTSDILVTWETASETDNLGFNLYRATTPDGTPEQLNGELIPSQVPGGGGAIYEWEDTDVEIGTTYYYWLEAVDIQGNGSPYFGPVSATFGAPTAVTLNDLTVQSTSLPMLLAAGLVIFGAVGWLVVRRR